MRQIKFRVWDSETPTMIPPTDIDIRFINGSLVVYYCSERHYEGGGYIYTSSIPEEIKNPILMQFTGLHDRNGVEIYESDILLSTNSSKHIVLFENSTWGVKDKLDKIGGLNPFLNMNLHFWKVIGNIYEHPNLLINE